jgi:hypothetical protein
MGEPIKEVRFIESKILGILHESEDGIAMENILCMHGISIKKHLNKFN